MSSNENISRQINTALEYRKQEVELQKEKVANSELVTRENRTKIGSMDLAKLKIKALRRSTLKRQGSSIDIKKLVEDTIRNKNNPNRVNEEDEDLISSSSSSDNTIIDGEVVEKLKVKSGFQTKRSSLADNEYHLTNREKLKLQEETQAHIRKLIKEAKLQAHSNTQIHLLNHQKSTFSLKDPSKIQKAPKYTIKTPKKQYYQMNLHKDTLLPHPVPSKTSSHFFKPQNDLPEYHFHLPNDINPQFQTTQNWALSTQKHKTQKSDIRTRAQTVSSLPQGVSRRTLGSQGSLPKRLDSHRSGNRPQSMLKTQSSDRFSIVTPYCGYKQRNKMKRKIFTTQLVPSRNKIIPRHPQTPVVSNSKSRIFGQSYSKVSKDLPDPLKVNLTIVVEI